MLAHPLTTIAHWLAGEFDNRAQSLDQPAWFVHLRLWHRPLPLRIEGRLALFAEQANVLYLDRAYRQRIVTLQETADPQRWQAQYFAFKQPDRFVGAGANPDLLESLSLDELEKLPGCRLMITQHEDSFKAEPEPEANCYFQYQGQTRQVVLGFEVSEGTFLSYDRGVDPETGASLWGALMGPYKFQRLQAFSWSGC